MLNENKYLIVSFFSKETGCDDEKPDDHADIELIKIQKDDSNNLQDCKKSCNSTTWGPQAIHITNGNDNNFFFNQHQ